MGIGSAMYHTDTGTYETDLGGYMQYPLEQTRVQTPHTVSQTYTFKPLELPAANGSCSFADVNI